MQTTLSLLLSLLDRLLHLDKQRFHLLGPRLLLLLEEGGQLPQVMGVAQSVLTRIPGIGAPPVMDRPPPKTRQDPQSVHGGLPTLWVAFVVGQAGRAGDVQPV